MDPQLKAQRKQTIKDVSPTTQVNESGQPVMSTAVSHAARVVGVTERITNAAGQDVVAGHRIVTEAEITVNDKIFLPNESTSSSVIPPPWPVQKVAQAVDEDGNTDFYRVWL